jgi:hypothetical protein
MRVAMRSLGLAMLCSVALGVSSAARAEQQVWRFDNLKRIGGFKVEVEGAPKLVASPVGPALSFNGVGDSVLVDGRALVGASVFTVEVMVRPDGGAFAQRFMHIAETNPATGLDTSATGPDRNARLMFEVRVKDDAWALDVFANSASGSRPLLFLDHLHPLGRWYVVTQTYDGKTYRSYVDGVLQGEGELTFTPHGPGRVRLGARMNRVDYFRGAIAMARFTDRALTPEDFLKVSQ